MDILNIKGYTIDTEKFDELRKSWIKVSSTVTECPLHNTTFCEDDEPCWTCRKECEVTL